MDSSDMSDRSNSSITQYDDALINLANARCGYKNSIVKYLARMTEADISRLKKMTYKNLDPNFPDTINYAFDSQSDQLSKQYHNSAILQKGVITQSENLKNEINDLKKITQKLRQEKENISKLL